MKILAVDDDEFILELLPMMLAKVGYQNVVAVESSDAALKAIETAESAFDCLLLDIQMAGMDGIELCGHLRQMPAYKKTPIIMLTAMTERSFIDSAFAAGATDYATKPIDIQELSARLRSAAELARAYRQAAGASSTSIADLSSDHTAGAPDISEEVQFNGILGLIGLEALGNYVTQLSRAGQFGSQVLAVKLDGIGRIHARSSSAEFTYALIEVADAISQNLSAQGYLMAYAGSGCFVCLSNSASLLLPRELEAAIQSLLDDSDPVFDTGDPMDIEVSVGDPLRPKPSAAENAAAALFERAIARAETRATQKPNTPKPPNIRAAGGLR